jgi:hypothetical protein
MPSVLSATGTMSVLGRQVVVSGHLTGSFIRFTWKTTKSQEPADPAPRTLASLMSYGSERTGFHQPHIDPSRQMNRHAAKFSVCLSHAPEFRLDCGAGLIDHRCEVDEQHG